MHEYLNVHPLKDIWVVFSVLACMNKAAINILVQFFFSAKLLFLCNKCPRVRLLCHMVAACLVS